MKSRDQLNESPVVSAAILLTILGACVIFFIWWFMPRTPEEREPMAWFYDQNTKELFTVPVATVGPIETESGPFKDMPAGVQANVYCCGPMVKDAETFIGYLEVATEDVPEALRPPGLQLSDDYEGDDLLIRRPEDDQWYVLSSPEAQEILSQMRERCEEGQQLTYARPPPE